MTPEAAHRKTDASLRIGIALLFCLTVVAVDPRGDFPLDDDWDFALTSWDLALHGEMQRSPFAAATSYTQAIWGAAWTLLFGQSYTVLRASTLALALASVLLILAILRRAGVSYWLALFGAVAFLAHPLFFWSAFTFMTHVPTVLLGALALWLFMRGVESGAGLFHVLAAIVGIASVFSRQTAVVNLLTMLAVVLILRERIGPRWRTVLAIYAGALLFLGGLLVSTDLILSSDATAVHAARLNADWLFVPLHHSFFNAQNAALFYAPLLLPAVMGLGRQPFRWTSLLPITTLFAVASVHMILLGRPIPYFNGGNVFSDLGLGPHTLRDTFTFRMPYPYHLPYGSRLVLMALSTVAAIVVAAILVRWSRRDDAETGARAVLIRYCAAYCLIGTAIHCGMRLYFDRYSIDTMWPLPILLTVLASRTAIPRWGRLVAAGVLAIVFVFSLTFTSEYLSWNRARWAGYRLLRQHGVGLERMDGGYEVNALLAIANGRGYLGKPGFGVADDEYILAFQEVPRYATLARIPYSRWLGLAHGYVYVLRRVR